MNYMYIVQTVVRFLNQGQFQLFVGGVMSSLRYLCLFSHKWCLVCPMLPGFVDCSFLIVPSIFSNVYFLLFDMVDVPW
jgi:hypothetical protein